MGRASIKENKNVYQLKREELPEEVLIMADKYKSSELCNYYCSNQCPIGQQYVPEIILTMHF